MKLVASNNFKSGLNLFESMKNSLLTFSDDLKFFLMIKCDKKKVKLI